MYLVAGEMTHPPWIERNMPIMFKNVHPVDNPESQGLHFVTPMGNLPDVPHKVAAKDSWYLWMVLTYGLTKEFATTANQPGCGLSLTT